MKTIHVLTQSEAVTALEAAREATDSQRARFERLLDNPAMSPERAVEIAHSVTPARAALLHSLASRG